MLLNNVQIDPTAWKQKAPNEGYTQNSYSVEHSWGDPMKIIL